MQPIQYFLRCKKNRVAEGFASMRTKNLSMTGRLVSRYLFISNQCIIASVCVLKSPRPRMRGGKSAGWELKNSRADIVTAPPSDRAFDVYCQRLLAAEFVCSSIWMDLLIIQLTASVRPCLVRHPLSFSRIFNACHGLTFCTIQHNTIHWTTCTFNCWGRLQRLTSSRQVNVNTSVIQYTLLWKQIHVYKLNAASACHEMC